MEIKKGEHISILGQTGSGKTFGAKNSYLPIWDQVIVVDTEDFDFDDFPSVGLRRAIALANSRYSFHVRVVFDIGAKANAKLDDLCYRLLRRKEGLPPLVVYFDEVTDFSDANRIPESLRALIRKARKRGISVVVGTQRPAFLNKAFLANTQHRVYYFVADYDQHVLHDYAPFLAERMGEIPFGSYRSLYQAPDGTVTTLAASQKYDWKR